MGSINVLVLEDDPARVSAFKDRFMELRSIRRQYFNVHYTDRADEAIKLLKDGRHFDLILLDHDLGGHVFVPSTDSNTGAEVARFMNQNPDLIKESTVCIHSLNPVGADTMHKLIPGSYRIPNLWYYNIFMRTFTDGGYA